MDQANDRITDISFRVLSGRGSPARRWIRLGDPGAEPGAMLDDWLASSELSCCSFQGGFFLDVNGAEWSDSSSVDELGMTMIWFEALYALLGGAASFGPGYGPWEQSALVWTRQGDDVTMADAYGADRMWSVTVDLPSLGLDVAVHGRVFASWAREVRRLAKERSTATSDDVLRERLRVIQENVPGEGALETIDALVARIGVL